MWNIFQPFSRSRTRWKTLVTDFFVAHHMFLLLCVSGSRYQNCTQGANCGNRRLQNRGVAKVRARERRVFFWLFFCFVLCFLFFSLVFSFFIQVFFRCLLRFMVVSFFVHVVVVHSVVVCFLVFVLYLVYICSFSSFLFRCFCFFPRLSLVHYMFLLPSVFSCMV